MHHMKRGELRAVVLVELGPGRGEQDHSKAVRRITETAVLFVVVA